MIVISLALLAFAAVPNPDPPMPSYAPAVAWFTYSNDSLLSAKHDDHRTAAFSGGCEWASADYQIGTDRDRNQRADELTVAGWYRADWWALGAGGRMSQNLGGQSIQSEWHRVDTAPAIICQYEGLAWELIVLGHLRFQRSWQMGDGDTRGMIEGTCLVEGSTHGLRSEAKARMCFGQFPTALCAGTVLWLDRVTALSGTAAEIQRDRGWGAIECGMLAELFSISLLITTTGSPMASITLRY